MKKLLAVLLACVLMFSCGALADLQRGDRNDDVKAMQGFLKDMGFLFDKADGIFGKNTEKAVKAYQRHAGMKENGIASLDMLDMLQAEWYSFMAEKGVDTSGHDWYDFWHMETPSPDGYAGDGRGNPCCGLHYDETGAEFIHHCEDHDSLLLEIENAGGGAVIAAQKWEEALHSLYDRWMNLETPENMVKIANSRSLFFASLSQEFESWQEFYPDDSFAAENRAVRLEKRCVELCEILHNAY